MNVDSIWVLRYLAYKNSWMLTRYEFWDIWHTITVERWLDMSSEIIDKMCYCGCCFWAISPTSVFSMYVRPLNNWRNSSINNQGGLVQRLRSPVLFYFKSCRADSFCIYYFNRYIIVFCVTFCLKSRCYRVDTPTHAQLSSVN